MSVLPFGRAVADFSIALELAYSLLMYFALLALAAEALAHLLGGRSMLGAAASKARGFMSTLAFAAPRPLGYARRGARAARAAVAGALAFRSLRRSGGDLSALAKTPRFKGPDSLIAEFHGKPPSSLNWRGYVSALWNAYDNIISRSRLLTLAAKVGDRAPKLRPLGRLKGVPLFLAVTGHFLAKRVVAPGIKALYAPAPLAPARAARYAAGWLAKGVGERSGPEEGRLRKAWWVAKKGAAKVESAAASVERAGMHGYAWKGRLRDLYMLGWFFASLPLMYWRKRKELAERLREVAAGDPLFKEAFKREFSALVKEKFRSDKPLREILEERKGRKLSEEEFAEELVKLRWAALKRLARRGGAAGAKAELILRAWYHEGLASGAQRELVEESMAKLGALSAVLSRRFVQAGQAEAVALAWGGGYFGAKWFEKRLTKKLTGEQAALLSYGKGLLPQQLVGRTRAQLKAYERALAEACYAVSLGLEWKRLPEQLGDYLLSSGVRMREVERIARAKPSEASARLLELYALTFPQRFGPISQLYLDGYIAREELLDLAKPPRTFFNPAFAIAWSGPVGSDAHRAYYVLSGGRDYLPEYVLATAYHVLITKAGLGKADLDALKRGGVEQLLLHASRLAINEEARRAFETIAMTAVRGNTLDASKIGEWEVRALAKENERLARVFGVASYAKEGEAQVGQYSFFVKRIMCEFPDAHPRYVPRLAGRLLEEFSAASERAVVGTPTVAPLSLAKAEAKPSVEPQSFRRLVGEVARLRSAAAPVRELRGTAELFLATATDVKLPSGLAEAVKSCVGAEREELRKALLPYVSELAALDKRIEGLEGDVKSSLSLLSDMPKEALRVKRQLARALGAGELSQLPASHAARERLEAEKPPAVDLDKFSMPHSAALTARSGVRALLKRLDRYVAEGRLDEREAERFLKICERTEGHLERLRSKLAEAVEPVLEDARKIEEWLEGATGRVLEAAGPAAFLAPMDGVVEVPEREAESLFKAAAEALKGCGADLGDVGELLERARLEGGVADALEIQRATAAKLAEVALADGTGQELIERARSLRAGSVALERAAEGLGEDAGEVARLVASSMWAAAEVLDGRVRDRLRSLAEEVAREVGGLRAPPLRELPPVLSARQLAGLEEVPEEVRQSLVDKYEACLSMDVEAARKAREEGEVWMSEEYLKLVEELRERLVEEAGREGRPVYELLSRDVGRLAYEFAKVGIEHLSLEELALAAEHARREGLPSPLPDAARLARDEGLEEAARLAEEGRVVAYPGCGDALRDVLKGVEVVARDIGEGSVLVLPSELAGKDAAIEEYLRSQERAGVREPSLPVAYRPRGLNEARVVADELAAAAERHGLDASHVAAYAILHEIAGHAETEKEYSELSSRRDQIPVGARPFFDKVALSWWEARAHEAALRMVRERHEELRDVERFASSMRWRKIVDMTLAAERVREELERAGLKELAELPSRVEVDEAGFRFLAPGREDGYELDRGEYEAFRDGVYEAFGAYVIQKGERKEVVVRDEFMKSWGFDIMVYDPWIEGAEVAEFAMPDGSRVKALVVGRVRPRERPKAVAERIRKALTRAA